MTSDFQAWSFFHLRSPRRLSLPLSFSPALSFCPSRLSCGGGTRPSPMAMRAPCAARCPLRSCSVAWRAAPVHQKLSLPSVPQLSPADGPGGGCLPVAVRPAPRARRRKGVRGRADGGAGRRDAPGGRAAGENLFCSTLRLLDRSPAMFDSAIDIITPPNSCPVRLPALLPRSSGESGRGRASRRSAKGRGRRSPAWRRACRSNACAARGAAPAQRPPPGNPHGRVVVALSGALTEVCLQF